MTWHSAPTSAVNSSRCHSARRQLTGQRAAGHRPQGRRSDMAAPEAADRADFTTNAIARLLASDMRQELLAIMREIFERNAFTARLAYSPDEAAELLGISRELVHDLLRTGQLGSVRQDAAG